MDEKNSPACRPGVAVVLRKPDHPISRKDIDPDAFKILYRLNKLGFIAYLCGGAVRDLMLGKPPKDFDIVTDARPGQIKKRFANVYIIGRRFRLAHIHFHGGKIIEVATFRKDAPVSKENPDSTAFDPQAIYGTPCEDAFRRDITINALYYDAHADSVIDYVGGLKDLACRIIRTIGPPVDRFRDDPVRIWRVLRHAARLGFTIDEATERTFQDCGCLIATSPGARLYEELNKDLAYETRPVIAILKRYGILRYILGRMGQDYEIDSALFSRLDCLLDIEDRARSTGFSLGPEEMYALIFYPRVEALFSRLEGDILSALNDAIENSQMQVLLPRSLRHNIIQILTILAGMTRALRTGRLRWSMLRRSHYEQASRLFFLIEKGRPPEPGESFENLFKKAFPLAAPGWKRRRRHRGPRA